MRYNDEVSFTRCLPFTVAHHLFLVGRLRSPMSYHFISIYYVSYSPSDRQGHIFFVSTQSMHNLYNTHGTRTTSSQVMQPKYISWLYIVRYVSEIYA